MTNDDLGWVQTLPLVPKSSFFSLDDRKVRVERFHFIWNKGKRMKRKKDRKENNSGPLFAVLNNPPTNPFVLLDISLFLNHHKETLCPLFFTVNCGKDWHPMVVSELCSCFGLAVIPKCPRIDRLLTELTNRNGLHNDWRIVQRFMGTLRNFATLLQSSAL